MLSRIMLGLLILAHVGCKSDQPIVAARPIDSPDREVEALISQLTKLGEPTVGTHPTAWSSGFMAIDEEPEFRGGILGSATPVIDPAMQKLIRMGVRALPGLIKHLSDARPTHHTEKHEFGFGAMWHSDEYAPRYRDPRRQPKGVNLQGLGGLDQSISSYTMKVGDMCYVAIGQIINRGFCALRYQPTACLVINSPVETPALAKAVRSDWGSLTIQQHKDQLESDALDPYPFAEANAVKRLCYYYPTDGQRLALKLLARKPYANRAVWDMADKMVSQKDLQKCRAILMDCQARYGKNASSTLPHWIHWSNWETSSDHPKETQARATLILKTYFPKYDINENVFYSVTDLSNSTDIINALNSFPNKDIDTAVQKCFREGQNFSTKLVRDHAIRAGASNSWFDLESTMIESDEFSFACAKRMQGKGYDQEYLAYFKRRIREINKTPKDSTERYRLGELSEWAKKLGG